MLSFFKDSIVRVHLDDMGNGKKIFVNKVTWVNDSQRVILQGNEGVNLDDIWQSEFIHNHAWNFTRINDYFDEEEAAQCIFAEKFACS